MSSTSTSGYPGIGRAAYIANGIAILLLGIGIDYMPETLAIAVALVIAIWAIQMVVLRLKNIGKSGWWVLGCLVPLLNIYVALICLCLPTGYQDHKQMDTKGLIIGAVWLVLVATIYMFFHA